MRLADQKRYEARLLYEKSKVCLVVHVWGKEILRKTSSTLPADSSNGSTPDNLTSTGSHGSRCRPAGIGRGLWRGELCGSKTIEPVKPFPANGYKLSYRISKVLVEVVVVVMVVVALPPFAQSSPHSHSKDKAALSDLIIVDSKAKKNDSSDENSAAGPSNKTTKYTKSAKDKKKATGKATRKRKAVASKKGKSTANNNAEASNRNSANSSGQDTPPPKRLNTGKAKDMMARDKDAGRSRTRNAWVPSTHITENPAREEGSQERNWARGLSNIELPGARYEALGCAEWKTTMSPPTCGYRFREQKPSAQVWKHSDSLTNGCNRKKKKKKE
ncbi:hypothetical protein BDP55DRAFT_629591 [Colletotrichum godetiae]|uniref:Uncharacterized protein n=1 Tax=Colletotrichum godetiae TaxID=1209918 RepID=A0AAJ0AQG0_9PEZI|nr:uncharacterized protein BDP55DRAFT_629591 [Colletotrichum godetiae]KAK1688484.1 hypothetical protein BDP55DRAFT_629591 [Colletotrichum godetiae]